MSKLFQIGIDDGCGGLLPIVKILRQGLYPVVQIVIPILLIIFGVVDLGKAVIASDEKEVKAAQGRLIKRCIYAAAIFFVVTFVSVIMDMIAIGATDQNTGGWNTCWNAASKK